MLSLNYRMCYELVIVDSLYIASAEVVDNTVNVTGDRQLDSSLI